MHCSVLFCVILYGVTSASCGSLRIPRQLRPNPFEDQNFHFPGASNDDPDRFNEIIDLPRPQRPGGFDPNGIGSGSMSWPNNQNWGGWNNNEYRPNWGSDSNRPNWGNNGSNNSNRPRTSTSTTTSTTERSSTPRTFHLAPEGCDCPSTPQFNPVCGSDGNTYKNSGLLKCFRACGIEVVQRRMGAC